MPLYNHYNDAKKALALPVAQNVGACVTCSFWSTDTPRPQSDIPMVGLCLQPALKPFALLVSGSSACNHWAK